MRLILASGSPRRRQLLADAGVAFELAEAYRVEELWPAGLPADRVAEYLAGAKSDAFPRALADDEVLLTADTTVILPADASDLPGGSRAEILGKPADRKEAIGMLERLSGRQHRVVTGVVLRGAESSEAGREARRESFSVTTRVWFRRLRREEIEYYVDNFEPMDKAGAYGIQEWIGLVGVERIDGSYYNVMGLPIRDIYEKIRVGTVSR